MSVLYDGSHKEKNVFYTIGNSHAKWGFENIDSFFIKIKINWLGPKLMFSIVRDGFSISLKFNENDKIIFCFGEIDCRCHIYKYKENYIKNIDDICEGFILRVLQMKNSQKIIPYIFNVVPPTKYNKRINNKSLPFLGLDNDRKIYHNYMNKKLFELCCQNNIEYLDVYDCYCDNEGFLNNNLSDGNVHIQNPFYIQYVIEKFIQ